jgi:hypothetical protein
MREKYYRSSPVEGEGGREGEGGGVEGRRVRRYVGEDQEKEDIVPTNRRKEDIVKTMSVECRTYQNPYSNPILSRGDLRRPAPRLHDGFRSLSIRTAGRPGAPSPKQILPGRVGCSTLVPHNTVSPSLSPEACTRLRWHGTVSVQGGVQV